MNKYIIKWKEEGRYFYQTAPTAIIDYHYFTINRDKAHQFNLISNAQEMIKELGEGTFIIETVEQTELDQFMQFMESHLDKFREGAQARKTLYAMYRLYELYKKEMK